MTFQNQNILNLTTVSALPDYAQLKLTRLSLDDVQAELNLKGEKRHSNRLAVTCTNGLWLIRKDIQYDNYSVAVVDNETEERNSSSTRKTGH